MFSKIKNYSKKKSWKFHLIITIVSLILYASIIVFGFVPVSKIIEKSGFSTSDLQNATTKIEADAILLAWQGIMNSVVLLSILDYFFILSGIILFFTFNLMIYKKIDGFGNMGSKLLWVPLIGFILTIASRLLDSLENLWIILIYSNPINYPEWLLPLTNYTSIIKWGFVTLEYAWVVAALILILITKYRKNSKNQD